MPSEGYQDVANMAASPTMAFLFLRPISGEEQRGRPGGVGLSSGRRGAASEVARERGGGAAQHAGWRRPAAGASTGGKPERR